MASTQQYLDLISQYESNNQNVYNYLYATNPQKFSAQGYYQITNTNWNNIAPLLGIDTSLYPTAITAPQDVQAEVAAYLLTQTSAGISNWGGNPQLMAALSAAGLQTSGAVTGNGTAGGPLVDLSGNAATTPTASIMDQLTAAGASVGLSPSTTDIVVGLGVGVGMYLLARLF